MILKYHYKTKQQIFLPNPKTRIIIIPNYKTPNFYSHTFFYSLNHYSLNHISNRNFFFMRQFDLSSQDFFTLFLFVIPKYSFILPRSNFLIHVQQ